MPFTTMVGVAVVGGSGELRGAVGCGRGGVTRSNGLSKHLSWGFAKDATSDKHGVLIRLLIVFATHFHQSVMEV